LFRVLPWVLLALALVAGAARAQAMRIPQTSAGLMPNAAAGKALYAAKCAQCHGADLRGAKTGPPLLHPVYVPSHHSDASFQLAVKYGSRRHHWNFGDMAPVPGLTPDDVAHITAYVRGEQRKVGIQ
jgi:mono/diheme cytochrome c family protein